MKNKKLVFVLAATMLLAACGKGGNSSASQPASEDTPTSSQVAPTSSEAPATSSSAEQPASSSQAPVSSSQAPVSSSSSEAPAATMTKTGIDLAVEGGKVYAVVKGTAANYKAGEFKFAWGLEHVTEVDGGEGFAYGSAEPADADYKEAVTIAADGTFEAKFCLTDAVKASGLYKVYAGAKGFYGTVASSLEIGSSRVKDGKYAYNYRSDAQCNNVAAVAVDELPPIVLSEAMPFAEGDQTWVRIGGVANITEAEAQAYTPFVQFQNVNNWRNSKMSQDKIRWNFSEPGKAYIEVNVTGVFTAGANFNTHLNLKENKQQDCKMETAIDEHYIINGLDIEVFSDPTSTEAGAVGFWGNLGWRITAAPAAKISAKANEDVSNVKFSKAEWNNESFTYDPVGTPSATLNITTPSEDGELVMVTWESSKKVTAVTVNGEPVDILGDHKAFFRVSEAITYTVEFAVADSLVTWSEDFPEMDWAYIDVEIRSANENEDIYMAEGGETSIGWDYTEGDIMVITPMLENGYAVTSLKVNGEELEAQQIPTFMGYMTAYVYEIPAAGEYTITCEYEEQIHYTASAEAVDGVSNVKFAVVEWNNDTFAFDPVGEPADTLDAINAAGKTVMITWEGTKKVTQAYANGEPITTGDGKAFFTIDEEELDYSITFDVADSKVTWDEETEHLEYVDIEICRADDEDNSIMATSDPWIDWAYAEGDYAKISPTAEDGYEVVGVKINGVACEMKVESQEWWGQVFTQTYFEGAIPAAGEYAITFEIQEKAPEIDSSISWTMPEGVSYVDVSVYPADGDVIAIEEDGQTSLEWAFQEGDMVMIMALPETGKVISSVKVNDDECMEIEVPGPGGSYTAYAFNFTEAGEYTITIETEDNNPFEEGGEAGPTDGTVEEW